MIRICDIKHDAMVSLRPRGQEGAHVACHRHEILPARLSLDLEHMLLNYRHWSKLLNLHVKPAILERDYPQTLFRSHVVIAAAAM